MLLSQSCAVHTAVQSELYSALKHLAIMGFDLVQAFTCSLQDYVKELGNCLSAMKFNANDHIRDKLAHLVLPALRLRGTRCVARNALPADATCTPQVDSSWHLKVRP